MTRFACLLGIALFLSPTANAQFQSQITTYYSAGNACYGNLFDVMATNDLTVCSFDIHLDAGAPASTINVWAVTGGGSWQTAQGNASLWTLIGTTTVTGVGIGSPTPLNLNLGYQIPAGTVQGFIIEKTVGSAPVIRYTNGTSYGSIEATNADVTIYGGGGICAPGGFAANTTRNWNGTMYYELGLNPTCVLPNPPGEYQINQPGASMTLNGQLDPGPFGPILQASAVGTLESIDLASVNVGAPYDVALVIPGMTLSLNVLGVVLGNQTVNIDLGDPNILYLNGGAAPNLATSAFPAPTFSIPFAANTPFTAAGQMVALDPVNPAGYSISHACQYEAATCNINSNFDNISTGVGGAPIAWINPAVPGASWTVNSGGTPSTGTGPTSADSGSNYMFCETSGATGQTFTLDTCPYDITQISGVTGTLTFALSRIGATIGTLNLLVDDNSGAGFVPITDPVTNAPVTWTGADLTQNQGLVEWTTVSVPFLHNVTGSVVAIRFSYTAGTSFTGDLAIDTVVVN